MYYIDHYKRVAVYPLKTAKAKSEVKMRIFHLSDEYNVVCNSEGTRYGFRHIAVLHRNGYEIARAKACYYNRTWESFEFETVILKVIEDNFEGTQKQDFRQVVSKYANF